MQSSKLLSSQIVQSSPLSDVPQSGSNPLNVRRHHKPRVKRESQHRGDQRRLESGHSRSTWRTHELDQCAAKRNRTRGQCVPVETPNDCADESRRLLSRARPFEGGGNDEEDDRGAPTNPKGDGKQAKKLDYEEEHRVILSERGTDAAP